MAHFIEYSILGMALRFWAGGRAPRTAWFWLVGVGFGGADEIHQRFIPGRFMSFWDFTADACGLLCGYFLFHRLRRGAAGRRPSQNTLGGDNVE